MDWNAYLCEAFLSNDLEQMQAALEQGADPNVIWHDKALLYWAAGRAWTDAVRLLLRFGAKVGREPDNDSTSLHIAVEKNAADILDLLLAADGKTALDRYDYLDHTPLMVAVRERNLELAQRLIAAGANVNAHDTAHIGTTALKIAAERGDSEITALLLKAGADPLIPGWMGQTPYDKALLRTSPEGRIVRELIEKAVPANMRRPAAKGRRKK